MVGLNLFILLKRFRAIPVGILLAFSLSWGGVAAGPARAEVPETPGADIIPVITYHDVLPHVSENDSGNPSVLSLSSFAAQMDYLHDNGYYTASLRELEEYVRGIRILPPKTVVITFDDGYESNYLYCYPYLKKYNFRAAIFLMGSVPKKARPHLTGLQIKNITSNGLVEIGSHTYDYHREINGEPALKTLPASLIKKDFDKFNLLMARIGLPKPSAIAYPYGAAGPVAIEAASKAGYRLGFTIERGYVSPGDPVMTLKRFNIGPDMNIDEFTSVVSGKWSQALPKATVDGD
ncbi:MAG: polysaccharide deacetylase family protein [Bacillota bacterium]